MSVLGVIVGVMAVLAIACWFEARSGKPAWGAHLGAQEVWGAHGPAKTAGSGVAATLAMGAFTGLDGGDG